VLRIQKGTGKVDLIGLELGCGLAKWRAAVVGEDGHLYCPPFYASRVLRIETGSGKTELIGPDLDSQGGEKWAADGGKWAAAVLGGDGHVYCPPLYASQVLRISISRSIIPTCSDQVPPHVANMVEKSFDHVPPKNTTLFEEQPSTQSPELVSICEIPNDSLQIGKMPLWEFLHAGPNERWESFPPCAQEQIEGAYVNPSLHERKEQLTLRIRGHEYDIDFATMTQSNVATNRQRHIRRTMTTYDDIVATRSKELEQMEGFVHEIECEIARLRKHVVEEPKPQYGVVQV